MEELKKTHYAIDIPIFKKLNDEAWHRSSRNSNIKDQIYYDQIKNGVLKTFCVRPDLPDKKIYCPNIKVDNYVSQHDIWLQAKKDFNTGIIEDIF